MNERICASRKSQHGWMSACAPLLLSCLLGAAPLQAGEAAAATAAESGSAEAETGGEEEYTLLEEVIVYATDGSVISGLHAESELDEEGVAAYGADTVGDLIAQVAPDVDNTEEGPVILINGRPANGIRSVNDLPSESVQSVQVLPPQAAGALGYSPTRRVINVVLKQSYGQKRANATLRGATAGRGLNAEGNAGVLSLQGNNIRQFEIRASKTQPLLEAHRGIQTQQSVMPYDLTGNVVAWPGMGGDIDPQLSALTGYPVTVLGVPAGTANPTLDDFVPMANLANVSDMGRYRTLISDSYNLGFNANYARQLPIKRLTSLSVNLNGNFGGSEGYTGASTALLHVPESSPWSPFSQDVGIARYLGDPLRNESENMFFNVSASLTTQLAKWRVSVDTSVNWRSMHATNQRRIDTTDLQAAIDEGTLNPFALLPDGLLGDLLTDRSKQHGLNGSMMLMASGTAFKLPAGNATASVRGELRHNEQNSRTVGLNNNSTHRTRFDKVGFLSLQLPLVASKNRNPQQGFGMAGELNGTVRDLTATRTMFDHGYGLNWRWGNRLNMRVGVNFEKMAPQPELLTNPIVTIDDYRAYDFIRQETVLVRYITGGNPDLKTENRRTVRFGGQVRPFANTDLNLNAEYQRTIGRDQTSSLPPVSEDVQAAFPDRYRRDGSGRLYEIDARLVSFARSETEQLRWGANFRRAFGLPPGGSPMSAAMQSGMVVTSSGSAVMINMDPSEELAGAGWRLNANFTHTLQLTNTRLARAGLPAQDLLAGGTGNGNGYPRHTVQGRVGLAHNGTGGALTFNWKSSTFINAGTAGDPNRIDFDSLLNLNLSAFTNLGTVFPRNTLLANSRVTLAVDNLLDAKQRVRDETGATPLRYQPYLINSLGRTISLSLRKTF